MLKKTLLRSLNILKISTWITAFIALAILLVIAFFVMFPQTIKGSLEDQLSQVIGLDVEIDKLSLEFQDNELLLAVKNLEISSKDLEPIASIDVLRWNVDLLALYQGIEIPGHIDINELIIDVSSINNYVSIINTDNILSSIGLTRLLALKSLSIDKTRLIGDQSLELAAIELKRNKERLTLSMRDQSLFSNSQIPKLGSALNINTTIDVTKATEDRVAVIPFSLKNEDFNLSAQLKIFNQQDRVYLEFESYIDEIEVSKINQNLPSALANTAAALWLDQVIDKGFLTDISLTTRFNMSGDLDRPNTKFSANLSNANLNLDSKWPSISDLNAKVNFSNDYLRLTSNKAQIDGIDLSYLSITSKDFNMEGSELSVNTRFNSQSKKVSEFIGKQSPQKTFIYRIHDEPDDQKLAGLQRIVSQFGHQLNFKSRETTTHSLNTLLKNVKGTKEQNLVDTLTIRCMSKAVYSTKNIGHYGLAFNHYSHFTSPIRRYPDVMAHRLLQYYLDGNKSTSEDLYEEKCKHSSNMEYLATKAERDSIKYMQVKYMQDHKDDTFLGVISGVTEWGMYVEIIENKCEGMIRIRDIKGDFYRFDAEEFALIGERTKTKYQLGDEVEVRVKQADLVKKHLDFILNI